MPARTAKRSTRYAQFAIAAAYLAIQDAGLPLHKLNSERVGVFLGNSIGGVDVLEEQIAILHEKGLHRLNPFTAATAYPQSAANQMAIEFKIEGPTLTIATGCPAGINSIEVAIQQIHKGEIDCAIVGGTEAPITPFSVAGFCASKSLANHNHHPESASRPFDKKRSGWVLSEGAGVIVLEKLAHTQSRSAAVYGEVLGCSSTNDAYSVYEIDPDGGGLYKAMKKVLRGAQISPQEIDYISAHGPSMVLTDKVETAAIKRVFGQYAYHIPVSSIKSMIGQPIAATGILQLVTCLLAFRESTIPPTINHEFPDPDCDLDYVVNSARKKTVETALINTHGYGGLNASLVVRKMI